MKYEIGDFVSKPVTGICKIEDILYLNPQDERNNILYYLMKPIEDKKEKIYVPVSNSDSRLRLCMTKEKAWNLIKRIPEIPTAWTNNEKMREQNYKAAIKANDPEALVAIIKMIYERKQKRLAQGKKCTATDARYFQMAENLLYGKDDILNPNLPQEKLNMDMYMQKLTVMPRKNFAQYLLHIHRNASRQLRTLFIFLELLLNGLIALFHKLKNQL